MSKSRRNFENSPDTGFFGKNISRIWNYFEVYIFRFIVAGIIVTLILFPIAIILNVVLSVAFALTAWLWIPVVLILWYQYLFALIFLSRFVFQLLIFDFDLNRRHEAQGLLSFKWFPLPFEIFRFLWKGVF